MANTAFACLQLTNPMTTCLFIYEGKSMHTEKLPYLCKLLPPLCTGFGLKTDEPYTLEKIKPLGSENPLSSSELV